MEQAEAHQMDTGEALASFALYNVYNLNMWVRKDYALLYDSCMAYFNHPAVKSFPKPPSVVITGQPGVGKLHDFSSSFHFFNSSFYKGKNLLDLLCRPPTPGRKETTCLVL